MINVTRTELPPLNGYNKLLKKIWKTHWVTNEGELVLKLEKKLSKLLRADNLVLVNNATTGLLITLKALDLKGDVITTPFTFAATTNVILWERLNPIFADIDKKTFNIDPLDVERKITKNTSAILAVHVYGNPCNMEELNRLAIKHNLKLIYDAAHAFNVVYKGIPIGDFGDASVLSFHATKTFHTIEGGAIITKSREFANRLRLFRNFGIKSEESVVLPGINAKMSEFQAAMGLANLPFIKKENEKRKKIYEYYKKNIKKAEFQLLSASRYNYSYMPVLFDSMKVRNMIFDRLLKAGIKGRKYFYPLVSDYPFLNKRESLPNSKNISRRVLCLPIYADLKQKSVDKIVKIINIK